MQKMVVILFTAALCLLTLPLAGATEKIALNSPDNQIRVTIEIKEKLEPYPPGKRLYYAISMKDQPMLIDSPIGLAFKNQPPLAKELTVQQETRNQVNEEWTTVWGKTKVVKNHYNELQLVLQEANPPQRQLNLIFRAFNDGVAWRYFLPEQANVKDFALSAERSEFHFAGNHPVWAANYGHYATHQETEFKNIQINQIKPGDIIGCPLLVRVQADAWVALTEANLTDWAGMYFTGLGNSPNAVVTTLAPRPDEPDVVVRSTAPRYSPWRVIMMGARPGDLIESNIILNLNEPCQIKDTGWIKPGKCAWDRWWCGSYAPDFEGQLAVDNRSMKYFIDFAGEMGWEYMLVDWYWYGNPFDPTKPFGSAGNPAVSILKQMPEIDIPHLVQYGQKKGVKILIWLDWFTAEKEMEQAFPLYEKWGVAGVKVDFMARDDQEMVNFYHRLVKLAANHHLTVDFHGAYKPTGFRRTYPNLLTREGVLGNEYNKWSDRITPGHNVTLPFTRMLCGPMDYTPGGFRNKTVESFRIVGGDAPGPFVMTTRTQQLAMMVVYESPLQVLCDSPYNYRVSPAGLDLLKRVPTTWDNTLVLDGLPGEFIVIARQSGEKWFVGGMNNEQSRTVAIPLNFLGTGKYQAKIWADPEEAADYPDRVWIEEKSVTASTQLTAKIAAGGGYVVYLVPVK